ncbi:MAG TPA: tetratricopeptide repeat protein [Clostridiaceae bacterium]|nr:tetratricopeptide repeat protein [Clostridiaceae bacterium]
MKTIAQIERKLDNKLIVIGIIAFITLIAYCNSFAIPFLLDDFSSIVNNYDIRNPFDLRSIWNFYTNRFVLYFTLSINYAIHDTSVYGYHIVNTAIHIFNGIILYFIINYILGLNFEKNKLAARFRNVISMVGSLVFVTHPMQINAVSYIVQRTASLAACFYLLSIFFFLKYRINDKKRYFIFMLISIILAMFTKENTITIPFMLALLDFMFFLKDREIKWIKRAVILIIIFLTVPIIPGTNIFLKGFNQSDPNLTFKASTSMERNHYFYTQMNVILLYIRLLFIPYGQCFDYSNDFPISKTIWENNSYISFIILLIIGLIGLYNFKKNKLLSLGILWFFIGLSVESSFISIKDVYFEHRVYFPLAGFVIFLIGLIFPPQSGERIIKPNLVKKSMQAFMVLSCLIIIMLSGLTIARNYIYSDTIRLWQDTVKKAPNSDRAHSSLAGGYLDSYEEDKEKNKEHLELAEKEYIISLQLNPNNSTSRSNLAKVYLLKGEYEKCIEEAERANKIKKSKYAYNNIGSAYKEMGMLDKAIEAYLEGYKLDNRCTFILKALGNTYYEKGDYKNAKFYFEEFLKYNIYSDNEEIRKKLEEIRGFAE